MLYYICPLHSFFFLVTWIVARIDATANKVVDRALIKIGLSAVVLAVLYEVRRQPARVSRCANGCSAVDRFPACSTPCSVWRVRSSC